MKLHSSLVPSHTSALNSGCFGPYQPVAWNPTEAKGFLKKIFPLFLNAAWWVSEIWKGFPADKSESSRQGPSLRTRLWITAQSQPEQRLMVFCSEDNLNSRGAGPWGSWGDTCEWSGVNRHPSQAAAIKHLPAARNFERWTCKKVSGLKDWLSNWIYPSVYLEQKNGATCVRLTSITADCDSWWMWRMEVFPLVFRHPAVLSDDFIFLCIGRICFDGVNRFILLVSLELFPHSSYLSFVPFCAVYVTIIRRRARFPNCKLPKGPLLYWNWQRGD